MSANGANRYRCADALYDTMSLRISAANLLVLQYTGTVEMVGKATGLEVLAENPENTVPKVTSGSPRYAESSVAHTL